MSAGSSRGFTLVEIIVASVVALLVMGGALTLFSQFRRGFSRGEDSTVLLQEAALFVATLRRDLVNATIDPKAPPRQWHELISVTASQITLTRFRDATGQLEQVVYEYSSAGGGKVQRRQGQGRPKTLINGRIASLSWALGHSETTTKKGRWRQLWIDIAADLGSKPASQGKVDLAIRTKLFPVRLIRHANRL
jgi:prepilin-type N-terminal cleavage/methylation domain-containing protein